MGRDDDDRTLTGAWEPDAATAFTQNLMKAAMLRTLQGKPRNDLVYMTPAEAEHFGFPTDPEEALKCGIKLSERNYG
jgi:hypothetical protein